MELSEYVQRGLQTLADPGAFPSGAFPLLLRAAFRSLLDAPAAQAALDHPDLKHIDPVVLKHCHAAVATYILEAGKHGVDAAALSSHLEDCKFDQERIELFCTEYQVTYFKNLNEQLLLFSALIGRSLPHITDVSWRLEYQIKTNQLHKMYRPSYLLTLNVESNDSQPYSEISFSCSMEQLQDLVGKLKDASKSLERATQL
uniref:COMM domain-containing protein 3 n=1 Tax=Nannospalax galili TaxID=1026970 RepID=A0A8C6RHW4_NANGA